MTHELSETIETVTTDAGTFRVTITPDYDVDAPYNDGGSPVLRIGTRGFQGCVAQDETITSYRVHERILEALERWSREPELFERYVRAFHGVRDVVWFRSNVHRGGDEYVTLDPAHWREEMCLTDEYLRDHAEHFTGPLANADEYQAWLDGDVWSYGVEELATWHRTDPTGVEVDTRKTWETTGYSCSGFYGKAQVREAALAALEALKEATS